MTIKICTNIIFTLKNKRLLALQNWHTAQISCPNLDTPLSHFEKYESTYTARNLNVHLVFLSNFYNLL